MTTLKIFKVEDIGYLILRVVGVAIPIAILFQLNRVDAEYASALDLLLRQFAICTTLVVFGNTQYTIQENIAVDKLTIPSGSIFVGLLSLASLVLVNRVVSLGLETVVLMALIPTLVVRHYSVAQLVRGENIKSLIPDLTGNLILLGTILFHKAVSVYLLFASAKVMAVLPLLGKEILWKKTAIKWEQFLAIFFTLVPILVLNFDMIVMSSCTDFAYASFTVISRILMLPVVGFGFYVAMRSEKIAAWENNRNQIFSEVRLVFKLVLLFLALLTIVVVCVEYIPLDYLHLRLYVSQCILVLLSVVFGPVSQIMIMRKMSNTLNIISLCQVCSYAVMYGSFQLFQNPQVLYAHPFLLFCFQLYKSRLVYK